jgi:hypothetical protein
MIYLLKQMSKKGICITGEDMLKAIENGQNDEFREEPMDK